MQVGKRYIFVGTDDKTFTGDIVSLTDNTLTIKNRSTHDYQNGQGQFVMPANYIQWSLAFDELVVGQRYSFTRAIFGQQEETETTEANFISISGKYETVSVNNYNNDLYPNSRVSFPIYWIKHIRPSIF